ncbi:DNA polymerase epsilon subunit 3-like protein [Dinothrombium tinctorium]|uniref:DNA polymerase epsilon subunit 3 n=1 Tax=Dinothrombium tinctorium TaxID=1965070 RepID=A0A3S3RYK8_9ACAR|nr:DNA polymerase epsilon subunit 3-like protein [Dinothrombium tinctorium]
MAEKPEDFNLPHSVIAKLIKDALPENVVVSKDARTALSKATSFFILYLTSFAKNDSEHNERLSLTADDLFNAFNQLGFVEFLPHLQQCYDEHRKERSRKERLKARQKARNSKLSNAESSSQPTDLNLDSSKAVLEDCIVYDCF